MNLSNQPFKNVSDPEVGMSQCEIKDIKFFSGEIKNHSFVLILSNHDFFGPNKS